MFGFLFRKRQDEVRGLLSGRMNRSFIRDFQFGKRRESRGYICEVVWAVPFNDADNQPDFERVFPVVTKDISPEGLSLIHNAPVTVKRMLIGLEDELGCRFVKCDVGHATPLGYGFWQIGMRPAEVVSLDAAIVLQLQTRMDRFAEPALSAELLLNLEPATV